MSGEWIKMRATLFTHPKVLRLASMIGMSPECRGGLTVDAICLDEVVTRNVTRDVTVATLMRVWCAANDHTSDGLLPEMERSEFDLIAGIDGFSQMLESVGWLEVNEYGLIVSLPKFLKHNIPSKNGNRNSAAERQRAYRERMKQNSNGNGDVTRDVTPLHREEKRREETKPIVAAKRRTQIPADFQPNQTGLEKAAKLSVDVKTELERFRDFHTAKGSVMLDWQAAWRTWVTNSVRFKKTDPFAKPETFHAERLPVNGSVWVPGKDGDVGRWVMAND